MEVEVRLFANFREAVGQEAVRRECPADARVGDLIRPLASEYSGLDLFEDDGTLRGYVTILKDGENVAYLDGLDTALEDGDSISVFPPVSGG